MNEEAPTSRRGSVNRSWEVLAAGPLALVEDRGRPGLGHLGVGRSGAADRAAHALGQRLVGNEEGAAAIEAVLGGLAVRARGDALIALTGAPAPATIAGRQVGYDAPTYLPDGAQLRLGVPATGLRTYVSVRGGIAVDPVLGSRSRDTLAGIGPAPLEPGAILPLGDGGGTFPAIDLAPVTFPSGGVLQLRLAPGPRLDWLADPAALTDPTWIVSSRSDRVGIRLEGPAPRRRPDREGRELASEGMVRGSIQVPPGGEPVLFLADHPVTGGYPVAAVVLDADVDLAAQARPGQGMRLRWVTRP